MFSPDLPPILFASVKERPWGCFSNFAPSPLVIDEKRYPTSEHYFQSQKFVGNPAYAAQIAAASSPSAAAKLGRSRAYPIRPDWDAVRDAIMLRALRAKFGQNPDLREILTSSSPRKLVEHRAADSYWGDGRTGLGQNRLGVLLMQVRSGLLAQAAD
jgi:ribA/ribD-fused uncharacterized protein